MYNSGDTMNHEDITAAVINNDNNIVLITLLINWDGFVAIAR